MIWAALAAVIIVAVVGSQAAGKDNLRELVKAWRKIVKKHVRDEARFAAANAVIAKAESDLLQAYDEVIDQLDKVAATHRDYSSDVAAFAVHEQPLVEASSASLRIIAEASLAFRQAISDEEYAAMQDDLEQAVAKQQKKVDKAAAKAQKKADKAEAKAQKKADKAGGEGE